MFRVFRAEKPNALPVKNAFFAALSPENYRDEQVFFGLIQRFVCIGFIPKTGFRV
jgi:hypothetical protein